MMLIVVYQFHVSSRHHEHFQHAWRAAQDALHVFIGLTKCRLRAPHAARQPFTMILHWRNQASFDRFTRTWIGVWLINGMGLEPNGFFAPTLTRVHDVSSATARQIRSLTSV